MNIIKVLNEPQWWRSLLGSDFNQGFMAALAFILALMLLLLFLRLVIKIIFRTRRCNVVAVRRGDGDTMVSKDVIAGVVERELAVYPAVHSEKIVLTKRGRCYQLTIYCGYLLSDQSGIPAFCDEFKPRLCEALEKGFGIDNISAVKLWIINSESNEVEVNAGSAPTESGSYIGL